jgi:hypothetical protein
MCRVIRLCVCILISFLLVGLFMTAPAEASYVHAWMITYPIGGEVWQKGSTYTITWDPYVDVDYNVFLSLDSGLSFVAIGSSSDGSLTWTVPYVVPNTKRARVYIKSTTSVSPDQERIIYDISTRDFTITTPLPEAPGKLAAKAESSSTIRLTWGDNSVNESGFIIEKRIGGDLTSIQSLISTKPNVTSYLDEGLVPFTTYYYRVKAYNDTGESGYSSEASATTFLVGLQATILGPPAAPSDLAAEALSHSEIRLTWQDNADDEQGFYLERNGTQIVTLPADTQTYTDTGLTPDTTYGYRVRAYSGLGTSEYSSQASATTDPEPPPSQSEPPPPASGPAPAPPGTATVIQLTIDSVEYYVNGQLQTMDTPPVIHEGRTLLPIRYVAEPLGAAVGWEAGQRKATVTLGQQTVELWIGQNQARVNGTNQAIDDMNTGVVPLIMPPGRTMLPLRFIAETLGCQVEWDAATRRVTITYVAQ